MNAKPLATVMTTVREPNSLSGSIGWRTVCWVRRKPAAASAATANAAITSGEAKPCDPASIAPKVNPLIAITPVTCPGRSKGTTRGREGSVRASNSSAIASAGTLMKKISRQSTRFRTPPSTGPDEEATAPPIAHTPTARPRALASGKACRISAIDEDIIAAAAAPCTNRAATSSPRLDPSPHATDARTNTTMPAAKARRAPTRSLSEPADSSSAANISA